MTQDDFPAADFEAEIARLRIRKPGAEPERRLASFAIVLALIGLVLLLVALVGTRQAASLQQQVDNLALAPLGLGVTAFGGMLWLRYSLARYFRFWLIRLIYEDRRNAERLAGGGADEDLQ